MQSYTNDSERLDRPCHDFCAKIESCSIQCIQLHAKVCRLYRAVEPLNDAVNTRRRLGERQWRSSTPTMPRRQFVVDEFKRTKAAAASMADEHG
jgi:hypothetical protein